MPRLTAVVPVLDEDPMALPVKALDPVIAFYQSVLDFCVLRRDDYSGCWGGVNRVNRRRDHAGGLSGRNHRSAWYGAQRQTRTLQSNSALLLNAGARAPTRCE